MYANCCGPGWGSGRRYLTKEEKTQILAEYAEELEKEAKGVRERIAELQAK